MERPRVATLRPEHRRVDDLLDAVHVAGEAGHDDPLVGLERNTRRKTMPTVDSDAV